VQGRDFVTPLGPLRLWAAREAFESDAPYVLVIGGTFSVQNAFFGLAEQLAPTPVVFGHVPGFFTPPVAAHSVGAYATAYGAAIGQLGRPLVLAGLSLGATTALAVRSPHVRAVLAMEPLMTTQGQWALARAFRQPEADAIPRDFLWQVFGFRDGEIVEARNYFAVLDGLTAPTIALFADAPLGPPPPGDAAGRVEPGSLTPSVLSAADRARLAAHSKVRFRLVVGADHDLRHGGSHAIIDTLKGQIAEYL
jgi:hypothetical protein